MPLEEGFPAYLPSRLAEFYERAGRVRTLNGEDASVTIIASVSPPGGDFSEPVTSHTKRFVRCFWALDRDLANARHYPSVGWIDSYSEYVDEVKEWWHKNIDKQSALNTAKGRFFLSVIKASVTPIEASYFNAPLPLSSSVAGLMLLAWICFAQTKSL